MPEPSDQREAAIDRLYALPRDEFTAARDELSRRLRREGDDAGAAEVKAMRKPSVAAWALNQVRRNDPSQSTELIEAGESLREGQEQLLAGGGRELFDRAAADERRLVAELARHAGRELVAAGRAPSASVEEKLRATLHAVASDPEAREKLASGRFVREHEARGIGPIEDGAASEVAADRKQRRKPSAREMAALERKARQAEERLERARARQQELDEETADAGRRLREARREASRAATGLARADAAEKQARERAEKAAAAAKQLERELRELTARRSSAKGR